MVSSGLRRRSHRFVPTGGLHRCEIQRETNPSRCWAFVHGGSYYYVHGGENLCFDGGREDPTVRLHRSGSRSKCDSELTLFLCGENRGFSGTVLWTIGLALVTDSVPEERAGVVIGYTMIGFSVGQASESSPLFLALPFSSLTSTPRH